MVIVRLRAMLSVCLRAMPRPLGMPMLLLPRIHHLNRPRSFWLRLCKPLRLLWQRNRLRYLAQLLRPCQTKANLRRPLARPVRWPLGVPSLPSSQATAFAASGAGFAAHSTSAGASAAQGRPAFVVPTFVSTFLPLTFTVHCQHGDHFVPGKCFICCHVAPGQHFVSDFVPRAEPALHCRSCESSRPSGGGEVH